MDITDKTKLYLTDGTTKYCISYSFKTHWTKQKNFLSCEVEGKTVFDLERLTQEMFTTLMYSFDPKTTAQLIIENNNNTQSIDITIDDYYTVDSLIDKLKQTRPRFTPMQI